MKKWKMNTYIKSQIGNFVDFSNNYNKSPQSVDEFSIKFI